MTGFISPLRKGRTSGRSEKISSGTLETGKIFRVAQLQASRLKVDFLHIPQFRYLSSNGIIRREHCDSESAVGILTNGLEFGS